MIGTDAMMKSRKLEQVRQDDDSRRTKHSSKKLCRKMTGTKFEEDGISVRRLLKLF